MYSAFGEDSSSFQSPISILSICRKNMIHIFELGRFDAWTDATRLCTSSGHKIYSKGKSVEFFLIQKVLIKLKRLIIQQNLEKTKQPISKSDEMEKT